MLDFFCSPFEAKSGPSESVALYRHIEAGRDADVGAHAIALTLEYVYRGYRTVLARDEGHTAAQSGSIFIKWSSVFPRGVFLGSLQTEHDHTPSTAHSRDPYTTSRSTCSFAQRDRIDALHENIYCPS